MNKNNSLCCRAALGVGLMLSLCGCQQFRGIVAKVTNKNASQTAYKPPTAPQDEPVKPLTPEQKADVQMAVARSLENQGDSEPAIKAYLEVVKKDPRRADAYHRLAVLHDSKGDPAAARKFFEIAVKRQPKNAEFHCDFGYSCYLQRNWGEGESHLRRAIALDSDCARAHTNLGLLLARTLRADEAIVEFRKAGCDEAAAHANVGFALTLEEHWTEAQEQFELALAADPKSKVASDGLAAIRWRNGESQRRATPASQTVAVAQPEPPVKHTAGAVTAAKETAAPPPAAPAQTMPTIQATYEADQAPENTQGAYRIRGAG